MSISPAGRPRARRGPSWGRPCRDGACTILILIIAAGAASAQDAMTRNLNGSPGLIDMYSARMAPEGELSFNAGFFKDTQRYTLGFQVFPWLETNFHYTGLNDFEPSFPVYYDRSFSFKARLWDETEFWPAVAVGVTDLVGTGIYSGEYVVASKRFGAVDTTIGIGWGRLSSTQNFRNPLALISKSFEKRVDTSTGVGQFAFNEYFRGPKSGIFGGFVWHTPVAGLSLIAEASSDAYLQESAAGNFSPANQFNFGLSYQPSESISLGLSWFYGRSIAGNITFRLDPTVDQYPSRLGPDLPPPHIRSADEQQQAIQVLSGKGRETRAVRTAAMGEIVDALWARTPFVTDMTVSGDTLVVTVSQGGENACGTMAAALSAHNGHIARISVRRQNATLATCPVQASASFTPGIIMASATMPAAPAALMTIDARQPAAPRPQDVEAAIKARATAQQLAVIAVSVTAMDVIVYYRNSEYAHETDAVDRLMRILMAVAPPNIERFRLIAVQNGIPQREFEILRTPMERNFVQLDRYSLRDGGNSTAPAPWDNPVLARGDRSYPSFSWTLFPQFRQQLFDPTNPFAVQLLAAARGTVDLFRGFSVTGQGELSLYDNFNVGRPSDSVLPHVRTDFVRYFSEGKNGINDLTADYRFRLAPNVFAVARGGYLESMFAGVGGEVLWRPEGQRWALGVDMFQVWQRKFDRLFGLQNYQTFTGHVSLYYQSPWYQLNFRVMAGQYLAGDRGLTLEVTRRFATGIEVGAFVTKTNVSAVRFGEGSFDKGIMIRMPLAWALPINTQAMFGMDLRLVQRDGGQRLSGDTVLYEETRRTSYPELVLQESGKVGP